MPMRESFKAYEQAGMNARYHYWEKAEAIEGLTKLLEQLTAAPPEARPRLVCRPGLKPDGVVSIWLFVTGAGNETALESHEPPDGFDQSHPCPPFC